MLKYFNEQLRKDLKIGDKVKLNYFTWLRSVDRKEAIIVLHSIDYIVGDQLSLGPNLRFVAYIPAIPCFERL